MTSSIMVRPHEERRAPNRHRVSDFAAHTNLLEPPSVVRAFVKNPPVDFHAFELEDSTPAFQARFDILTTLDDPAKRIANTVKALGLERFRYLPALFIGTTVSEYAILPASLNDYSDSIDCWLNEMTSERAQLLIVKDIPGDSPLLSAEDNESAARLVADLRTSQQFLIVSGQALAYVPIDFATTDEYLSKLKTSRRKELKRKLKSRSEIKIEQLSTGDPLFLQKEFLVALYGLYLSVYEQSEIHFDKLTFSFFADILQNANNGGVMFVYRKEEKIVGWNLCFVFQDKLIDKYIGLAYPDSRELNLYFVSWFHNLEYALKNGLKYYVAGWTDPEVKAALGASFTFTQHAVCIRNPLLRAIAKRFQSFFEPDKNWAQDHGASVPK